MATIKNSDKMRKEVAPMLEALLEDTLAAAKSGGRSLTAAVLFGSATGQHYVQGKSDINTFMVFDQVDLPLLKTLLPVFNRHFKKLRARPIVVDSEFIADSTDVFPMEFLEWKEGSVAFHGVNPLDTADISRLNLRLEIEENLRGKNLRLTQSYFEVGGNPAKFRSFLESTLPTFFTVFRNILRLTGAAPERDQDSLIKAIETKTGLRLVAFRGLLQAKKRRGKLSSAELDSLFSAYIAELDALTRYIDSFETEK
ncbi:MAG: hypothetical protein WCX65_07910 [bacterium]